MLKIVYLKEGRSPSSSIIMVITLFCSCCRSSAEGGKSSKWNLGKIIINVDKSAPNNMKILRRRD
jgi:hypothetical protein